MAERVRRPIARRRPRALSTAVVSTVTAAVAVLSIVLAPAASAGGYIVSDTYFCSDGLISIKPPRTWTTNARPEQVYWAPVYFQWTGSRWVAVAHNDWAIATVNNQGYAVVGWTDTVHYYGVGSRSMGVNQAGYYAVANYLVWTSDASTLFQFASPPDSRGYCTFTTRNVGAGRGPLEAPAAQGDGQLSFADRLVQPARAIVSMYLDATIAQAPAPAGVPNPSPPA